jgi:hypothetical protein
MRLAVDSDIVADGAQAALANPLVAACSGIEHIRKTSVLRVKRGLEAGDGQLVAEGGFSLALAVVEVGYVGRGLSGLFSAGQKLRSSTSLADDFRDLVSSLDNTAVLHPAAQIEFAVPITVQSNAAIQALLNSGYYMAEARNPNLPDRPSYGDRARTALNMPPDQPFVEMTPAAGRALVVLGSSAVLFSALTDLRSFPKRLNDDLILQNTVNSSIGLLGYGDTEFDALLDRYGKLYNMFNRDDPRLDVGETFSLYSGGADAFTANFLGTISDFDRIALHMFERANDGSKHKGRVEYSAIPAHHVEDIERSDVKRAVYLDEDIEVNWYESADEAVKGDSSFSLPILQEPAVGPSITLDGFRIGDRVSLEHRHTIDGLQYYTNDGIATLTIRLKNWQVVKIYKVGLDYRYIAIIKANDSSETLVAVNQYYRIHSTQNPLVPYGARSLEQNQNGESRYASKVFKPEWLDKFLAVPLDKLEKE